ncbi:MAG TPA: hypothetical protein VGE63_02390 [Candidatus Paceibacterota bacterium]
MSSWAFGSRLKILLILLLIFGGGFYVYHRTVISEKIVGLPECLKGVTDVRCYEGKKVAFGKVVIAENAQKHKVLIQEITNTLPFGYKGSELSFDVYTQAGVFIESITKNVDIAPLDTTLVVLTPKTTTQEPAMIIPTSVSLGVPTFVAPEGEQKIFTTKLFSVADSKFARSITVPIQIYLPAIPQKQTYTVFVTGNYRGEKEVIQKVYEVPVYFAEKDTRSTTAVVSTEPKLLVTNVMLSCTQNCL